MSGRLEVANLHAYDGTSHVLFGVGLKVEPGECVCLLGRNGVGKTTTLKSIMGLVAAREGRITYEGRDLVGLPPHDIARMGLGYAPDERLIFPDLTVRDNLEIAVKPPLKSGLAAWTVERVYGLFPALKPLDDHAGGYLSSRIESGRVTLSPQALDLREVAEDVIEDVLRRSQEENKPMALSLDAPRKLPLVFGDMERVRQALSNLVFNSYHYTPENGTITVHIHPLNDGRNQVQVDVEDTGVGIAREEQERIFERFYRGEHPLVLATPGTGLGLSIVKQIVEMHKGRIWMNSTGVPGEGSTFSFTLPVYEKNEA